MFFLPFRTEVNEQTIDKLKLYTMYISRTKNLPELKEKLSLLFNKNKLHETSEVSEKQIRLWKLGFNTKIEEVRKLLSDKNDEILADKDKLFDLPDLSYLERNNSFFLIFIYRHAQLSFR